MARWKKGQSGNPGGRPKSDACRLLDEAIRRAERHKDEKTGERWSFWDHVIAEARRDNTVLVAVLRKLVPDLRSVDADIHMRDVFRLVLSNGHQSGTRQGDEQSDAGDPATN